MSNVYRDLQHSMTDLFDSFFATPWDPTTGMNDLRSRMLSLFDEYPYGWETQEGGTPHWQREKRRMLRDQAQQQQGAATTSAVDLVCLCDKPVRHLSSADGECRMPRCDVQETPTEVIVHAELPGISKENCKIEVDPLRNMMTISGDRKHETEEGTPGSTYHRVERQYGNFRRSFRLPETCKSKLSEINARANNGVIEVHCPKVPEAEQPKPMSVNIQ
ncbi:putative Hsp20/alpha crystallin family protein [Paratrimastix pyriformis]|uniref:Hsp20/alpha crystallin family protein n=1 Tax=Paratrimastix pyriformis TaxID=342808 RepID=A0ABQ8UQJ6_9EUKA|nr:putative Hsp20/alpha crystallin family protein [Paratrimastix pyriformis]